jgi:hypothetical protein
MQQVINPIAIDMERVNQQLVEERDNIYMSAANIDLMSQLYRIELGTGMEFTNTEQQDGIPVYTPPTVYGTISEVEYEITMAPHNSLEFLWYQAVPSRIEDGETSYQYQEVIPRTAAADISSATPEDMVIEGHLYVTVRGNTTWEQRARNRIYYTKVFINGITRKGTLVREAVPIRYNGTFRTVNQWKSVESVYISYMDDDAEITLEVLPFDRDDMLDTRNLVVPPSGTEAWRFVTLGTQTWGSSMVSKSFTVSEIGVVQLGFDTKDIEHEVELLDTSGNNVDLRAAVLKPHTDYMFAVDADTFYVYNTRLPYPDLTTLQAESPDTKMDIYSDRWVYPRDATATVKTDILDISVTPWKVRWTLLEPDGQEYYLGLDGSKWPTTTDAWIENDLWEGNSWREQRIDILLDKVGVYILTLECLYTDPEKSSESFTLTTRYVLYVPAIQAETAISLPAALQNADGMMMDSDGQLWLLVNDDLILANIYYDYFIADYERKAVWLRENYSSVRVVP